MKKILLTACLITGVAACKKGDDSTPPVVSDPKISAAFSYTIADTAVYPFKVNFENLSQNARSYSWSFGNGETSTERQPAVIYTTSGNYTVRLIAADGSRKDSVEKTVTINIKSPLADFTFATPDILKPNQLAFTSTAVRGKDYLWNFGDGSTSALPDPTHTYAASGRFTVKLTVKNPTGEATVSKELNISNTVSYTSFDGKQYSLFPWPGNRVVILSRNLNLDPAVMTKWVSTMDSVYGFYRTCTGRDPGPAKILNGRSVIADVPATCGSGCGYLGATGIEILNTNFDIIYNGIRNNNQFDQVPFYEFGRNFWFYGDQLAYKTNDPVTTGYAVLMRFMSLDATGVQGGPFVGSTVIPFAEFKGAVTKLVDQYTANASLNWGNTLGVNAGVPGGFGGATDLFASFCMRLTRDYGGENFIRNVWKQAGSRPAALTTQDAVDNFILAACAAANKNLTTLFVTTWRWPMSDAAKTAAGKYP
ncbi:PKD domain-containing protein [Chitinophaga sp. OAE865]|uniref:PKD domain-containing protein n=1 Tax=Chitinophaga sp. OAE865 TaxID=2817898 RepID=UPI001AE410CB